MFKKKCVCGIANKNFKYDIGEFYVDECCKSAGYDDLGNRKSSGPGNLEQLTHALSAQNNVAAVPTPQVKSNDVSQKPSAADRVLAFLGMNSKKLTKSKLGDLRVDEIKKIAADRGVQGYETMTRSQLTEALLK